MRHQKSKFHHLKNKSACPQSPSDSPTILAATYNSMNAFLLLCAVLPNFLKILIYRRVLNWEIGYGVKIGFSYIDAKNVVLGDHVRIGHFNVIRNLNHFRIGSNTYIANFNSIFGSAYADWASYLKIGQSVNFMSHHFLDASARIIIGNDATVGGRGSQMWSHTRAYDEYGNPFIKPIDISIGNGVYVGANTTLIGCSLPNNSVIGAGSVVTKNFEAELHPILIAGNPATIKKRYTAVSSSLAIENTR
jgi:acetyltransferase-like isoleucine patch superfamily enzyme